MRVKATACIIDDDVRRALNKDQCAMGEEFDVPDSVAIEYFKRGVAKPVKKPAPVEFAATTGAPEQAISRRGRGRPRKPSEEIL